MALRLGFELPEFRRVVWANREARDTWEPRIVRVANTWHQLERLAVVEGIKPATLQVIPPEELTKVSRWALNHDLVCLPLAMQGVANGYSSMTPAIGKSGRFEYRVVIGNANLVGLFEEYWKEKNDELIGAALGFPPCCREFFQWMWNEQGWRDSTLPMSVNHDLTEKERADLVGRSGYVIPSNRVGGALECNILLRWLGLRLVSHLPCSFYCDATQRIGEKIGLLGVRSGFHTEMDWLTQMLSWPVRWESLHGVATITTPVLRVVTNSTALKSKIIVERDGPIYPDEGARGNQFPFKTIHKLTLRSRDEYTDNGFKSRVAMDKAHSVVVEVVLGCVANAAGGVDLGKVIDLGCGNGALLEKIVDKAPWLVPCGIEKDPSKHQRAARRLLALDPDLHIGDLHDGRHWNPPYSVAVVSVNRFREVDLELARELLARLRDGCHKVVIYSYDAGKWSEELDWVFEFLKIDAFHTNGEVFAVICEPRRDNDSDPVQR